MVVNDADQVLALERYPKGSGRWQMVQGGLQEAEEPRDAMYRELREEIGLAPEDVEQLGEYPEWIAYELPRPWRSAKTGRGQVLRWFYLRLVAPPSTIDLTAGPEAEFGAQRWTSFGELAAQVWHVKQPMYERLRTYFMTHIAR